MHGRLKVKTDAQKEAERKKEEHEKLVKYQAARNRIFELRNTQHEDILNITTQLLIFNCECNTFWNIRKEFILNKLKDFEESLKTEPKVNECSESNTEDNTDVQNGDFADALSDTQTEECSEISESTESKVTGSCGAKENQESDGNNDVKTEKLDDWREKFFVRELNFTVQCLKKNPKAYAVWLYREFIMSIDSNADWNRELFLCDEFLRADERNFHCWDYRRVVLKHLPERSKDLELKFTTNKIEDNFSNFSSWHYRTKLLCQNHRVIDCSMLSEETVREEIDLVFNALFTDPTDQSAWFYYKWLHGNHFNHNQSLISVMVLRRFSSISLLLSRHVSKSQIESTKVYLCSSPVRCTFKPVNPYTSSCYSDKCISQELSDHWIVSIISSSIPPFGKIEIGIEFPEEFALSGEDYLNLVLEESDKLHSVLNVGPILNIHQAELQKAFPDVEKYDSEMLLDLSKEEPNNKYVLLQLLSLHRSKFCDTNFLETELKCREILMKLTSIDPLRKQHYEDTLSDIILESKLVQSSKMPEFREEKLKCGEMVNGDCKEVLKLKQHSVELSGLGLTQIRRISPMFMLSEVNLSSNQIECIDSLAGFMNLKVLIIDDNKVSDLSPLYLCYSLNTLSAKNNSISVLDSFEKLVDCHLIASIDVSNNHVVQVEGFSDKIGELFPRLELLNGAPACSI